MSPSISDQARLVVDDLGVDDVVVVHRTGAAAGLARTPTIPSAPESRAAASYSFWLNAWLADISVSVAVLIAAMSLPFERLLEVGERLLDGLLLVGRDLVALLAEHLLGLVHERVGVVADLGLLTALAVVLGVGLGVLDHLVDVVLVERRLTGDGHRLLLVRRPVLGRHVDDAVGVDVEGDLDLRDAAGRRRQVDELELAERLVVARHLALALEHVDLDRRLHVLGGGEHLGALGRDGGVALDELGHHATLGLDAEAAAA